MTFYTYKEERNMKTENLLCTYQGAAAIDLLTVDKQLKKLKTHEIRTLQSFCVIMSSNGFSYEDFDGYFVSYSIKQIGKEFDLLRFGDDVIINVEIKSEIKKADKIEKIRKQMVKSKVKSVDIHTFLNQPKLVSGLHILFFRLLLFLYF